MAGICVGMFVAIDLANASANKHVNDRPTDYVAGRRRQFSHLANHLAKLSTKPDANCFARQSGN